MSYTPMILRLIVIMVIYVGADTVTETYLASSWWFLTGWIVCLFVSMLDSYLRQWDQLE